MPFVNWKMSCALCERLVDRAGSQQQHPRAAGILPSIRQYRRRARFDATDIEAHARQRVQDAETQDSDQPRLPRVDGCAHDPSSHLSASGQLADGSSGARNVGLFATLASFPELDFRTVTVGGSGSV